LVQGSTGKNQGRTREELGKNQGRTRGRTREEPGKNIGKNQGRTENRNKEQEPGTGTMIAVHGPGTLVRYLKVRNVPYS